MGKKDTILATSEVIYAFCDGSCWNGEHILDGVSYRGINGGFGIYIRFGDQEITYSEGGYRNTTSARMEIKGIIGILYALLLARINELPCKVNIYNDNLSAVNSFKMLLKCYDFENDKNQDLWEEAKELLKSFSCNISIEHVKGHQSRRSKDVLAIGNNKVHDLAKKAGKSKEIKIDKIICK